MFIMMVHANSTVSLQKHFLLISNTFKNVYILNVDRSPAKHILLTWRNKCYSSYSLFGLGRTSLHPGH